MWCGPLCVCVSVCVCVCACARARATRHIYRKDNSGKYMSITWRPSTVCSRTYIKQCHRKVYEWYFPQWSLHLLRAINFGMNFVLKLDQLSLIQQILSLHHCKSSCRDKLTLFYNNITLSYESSGRHKFRCYILRSLCTHTLSCLGRKPVPLGCLRFSHRSW